MCNELPFFHKLKVESSLYMCIKYNFSRVCRTHKNFQLFIKLLLKITFFQIFLFRLVHSKLQIFFYHLWNFHSIITNRILFMHFLRKWPNIYLNKKLQKKFPNHSNSVLVKLNISYTYNYFWIPRFHENLVSHLTWFDSSFIMFFFFCYYIAK